MGSHAPFILAAYAVTALVLGVFGALALGAALRHRAASRRLALLEKDRG